MLIAWSGPRVSRRIVAGYTWGPENQWACEVAKRDVAQVLAGDERFTTVDTRPKTRAATGVEPVAVEVPVGTDEFSEVSSEEEEQ